MGLVQRQAIAGDKLWEAGGLTRRVTSARRSKTPSMLGNERHRLAPTVGGNGVIVAFGKDRKSRPITIADHPRSMTITQAPHLNRGYRHKLELEGGPVPITQAPHVNPWHERPWRRGAVSGGRTAARCNRSSAYQRNASIASASAVPLPWVAVSLSVVRRSIQTISCSRTVT